MRDIAENLFLIEIKAQRNLRMLQIIIAAARVRLIRGKLRRGDKNRQHCRKRKKYQATAMVIGLAKELRDHFVLLL